MREVNLFLSSLFFSLLLSLSADKHARSTMRSSSKLHSGPTREKDLSEICAVANGTGARVRPRSADTSVKIYIGFIFPTGFAEANALLTRFVIVEMRGRLNFTVRMLKGCYRARVSAKEPSVNELSREGDIIAQEYLDNGTPRMPRENKRENKRVMTTSVLGEGKENFFNLFALRYGRSSE
jgi:hypothetical protein